MTMKRLKMASFEKIVMQPSESFPNVDESAKKKAKKITKKGRNSKKITNKGRKLKKLKGKKSKKRLSGGKRTHKRRKKNNIDTKLLEILIELL